MDTPTTVDQIQRINWEGSIPVIVSLAPTSLSSPTVPPNIHVLLSRQTYLHLGLKAAVQRLYPFAPLLFAGKFVQEEPDDDDNNEKETTKASHNGHHNNAHHPPARKTIQTTTTDFTYPVCWFEDESTNLPLRWHLFAGVLYDLHSSAPDKKSSSLPWRLRLHFNSYPDQVLLPLSSQDDVERQVRAVFSHSLKQAVTLRTGSGGGAMQLLPKESHERLWQAIAATSPNASLYRLAASELDAKLRARDPQTARIPVRLLLNSQQPAIQKSCPLSNKWTLGQLLSDWLGRPKEEASLLADDDDETIQWKVNGIRPPLSATTSELWEHLCHADYFLYIVVRYNTK